MSEDEIRYVCGKTTATPWSQNYIGYEMKYYVNDVTLANVEVLAETNGAGAMRHVYTYGNQRLTDEAFGAVKNFAYDGQGNVRQVMQSGSVVRSLSYGVYGEVEQGSLEYRTFYGYNGEEHNPETRLQYLRARYYEANSARFTSMDSYGGESEKPLTQNKYLYANGDPVNFCDPGGQAATAIKSSINSVKAIIKPITVIKPPPEPPKTTQIWKPSVSAANGIYTPSSNASSGGQISVLPAIKLDMQVKTLKEINRIFCSAFAMRVKGVRKASATTFEIYMRENMPINDPAGAPIRIVIKGNTIYFHARIHVMGIGADGRPEEIGDQWADLWGTQSETYGELVEMGIEKYWSGSYTIFGYAVNLVTYVSSLKSSTIPGTSCSSNHIDYILHKSAGRSFYKARDWTVATAGGLPSHLYPQESWEKPKYSKNNYLYLAAHEFGHALGVGDGYVEDGDTVRSMRDAQGNDLVSMYNQFGTPVQNRDIEMVLIAHHKNQFQEWSSYGYS